MYTQTHIEHKVKTGNSLPLVFLTVFIDYDPESNWSERLPLTVTNAALSELFI